MVENEVYGCVNVYEGCGFGEYMIIFLFFLCNGIKEVVKMFGFF